MKLTSFGAYYAKHAGRIWIGALAMSLAYGVLLRWQGSDLQDVLPRGILSLEMPWTSPCAMFLVDALTQAKLLPTARVQVLLDFGFLPCYAIALAASYDQIIRLAGTPSSRIGRRVWSASLLAAALDGAENVLMLVMLAGDYPWPIPLLTSILATAKFFLIGVCLLLIAAAVVRWLLNALRNCLK